MTSTVKDILLRQDLRAQDENPTHREKLDSDIFFAISQSEFGLLAITLVKANNACTTFEINTGRKAVYVACLRDPRYDESVLLVERRNQGGRVSLFFNRIDVREPQIILSSGIKDYILASNVDPIEMSSGKVNEKPCIIIHHFGDELKSYDFEGEQWINTGVSL